MMRCDNSQAIKAECECKCECEYGCELVAIFYPLRVTDRDAIVSRRIQN